MARAPGNAVFCEYRRMHDLRLAGWAGAGDAATHAGPHGLRGAVGRGAAGGRRRRAVSRGPGQCGDHARPAPCAGCRGTLQRREMRPGRPALGRRNGRGPLADGHGGAGSAVRHCAGGAVPAPRADGHSQRHGLGRIRRVLSHRHRHRAHPALPARRRRPHPRPGNGGYGGGRRARRDVHRRPGHALGGALGRGARAAL